MAVLAQYEAGALSAWTPAQQAALNAERYTKQLNHDQIEIKRDEERQARFEIQQQLDEARAIGDNEEKERLKKEQAKLDKKYGPEHRRWEDEATEVGKKKVKEKEKKRMREAEFAQARSVSAGQVIDNLVSHLLSCDQTNKLRSVDARSSRTIRQYSPFWMSSVLLISSSYPSLGLTYGTGGSESTPDCSSEDLVQAKAPG